jgi:hypothetical protein
MAARVFYELAKKQASQSTSPEISDNPKSLVEDGS